MFSRFSKSSMNFPSFDMMSFEMSLRPSLRRSTMAQSPQNRCSTSPMTAAGATSFVVVLFDLNKSFSILEFATPRQMAGVLASSHHPPRYYEQRKGRKPGNILMQRRLTTSHLLSQSSLAWMDAQENELRPFSNALAAA
jgi:hypothetical protein